MKCKRLPPSTLVHMQAMPSNICFTTLGITIRCFSVTVDPQRSFVNSNRLVVSAIAVSLALHLAVVPPAAQWLEKSRQVPDDDNSATLKPQEVVLPLADWILVDESVPDPAEEEQSEEEEANEKELGYARTTANQASLTSPESPEFVSDRNTLASSPELGLGDKDLPTVHGEDEDTIEVDEHRFLVIGSYKKHNRRPLARQT